MKVSHVVIVGGGFGGLYAAKTLKEPLVRVTVVDQRNFHLFQPLLYQVAAGELSPGDIASPIRIVLKHRRHVRVVLGRVVDIDMDDRCAVLSDGRLSYDRLIVAAGSECNYFGHDEWRRDAPSLKTVEDALEIRRRVFLAFETAEKESDPDTRRAWLTFVIIGGGPTGVELAGALGEIANHTLKEEFRNIDPSDAKILLIDASARLLTTFPPHLSAKAATFLEHLGVSILTEAMVSHIQNDSIQVSHRGRMETITAKTIIWAAGVNASPLGGILTKNRPDLLDAGGRVKVSEDFSLPGHPEVFVIGDLANYPFLTGQPLPGLAPVAMQEGRYVARVIQQQLAGKKPGAFRYVEKGNLAVIGRARAVGFFGKLSFSGYSAWLIWLFVHLMYLVEFENRLLVFVQWAWDYFTWGRGARLITETGGRREENVADRNS